MADLPRTAPVLHTRLLQSLPPVPPINTTFPQRIYRDNPDSDEETEESESNDGEEIGTGLMGPGPSQPPEYQPMYDYLRSKQLTSAHPPVYGSSPPILRIMTEHTPIVDEPYRDEPFLVTIDSSPPPPSYHDIYREHEIEMRNLERDLALDGSVDPAEQTEDLYKWLVAMMLIMLTIACVGTAFNWGR